MRGEGPSHAVFRSATRKGLLSKSMVGFGFSNERLGGTTPCFTISVALMRLATPAAVSRWPMFVFTEPTRQYCFFFVDCAKACVSAAISIGSPR